MKGFAFALVAVAAFNTGIAVLLTLLSHGGGFGENLVFSQCIGMTILLVIHSGWSLFWQQGKPPTGPFLALIAAGVLTGWLGGSTLAAFLLGMPWRIGRDAIAALGVTTAAGAVGTWFFWSRHKAAELERQGVQAQLRLLQAQIEPHFLFNTLANLDALIATDPKRARTLLGHLNEYLRATLLATRKDWCTLADEFALMRGYLDVQAVRMGERLAHSLELPDTLSTATVPPLLLQPLVENAIKHGLEPKMEGGSVRVCARDDGAAIVIEVADTGLGTSSAGGTGIGLANVRERLAAINGALDYSRNPAGGVTVSLRIPK